MASFGSSFALLKPCLWSKFAFSSKAIAFSRENSVPRLSRNSFLPKKHKNNTFRTLKNLEKPKFFQGFSRFHSFRILTCFARFFPSKWCPGCHFGSPKVAQGHPKGSQEVSWEAIRGCWGRPFVGVEPSRGSSDSLFDITWRL